MVNKANAKIKSGKDASGPFGIVVGILKSVGITGADSVTNKCYYKVWGNPCRLGE